jgi:hypothetical protein
MRKLDWVNESTRNLYNQLKEEIKLPSCAKWVEPNDADGVCGYSLGILFQTSKQAEKAITSGLGLGGLAAAETKGARDWHVYWNWEHVLEKKSATKEGCPFTCPHVEKLPDYSKDMCMKTKDIMLRLAVIGITPDKDAEWVEERAGKLNAGFRELF